MHFNKHIILILILVFWDFLAIAQDEYVGKAPRNYDINPAKVAGFIELGGNAGLYSFNMDRIYLYKEKFKMSVRAGFAPHMNGIYIEQEYVLENNFILFQNPHHLEIGIGATLQRRYNERPNEPDNYFWENIWFSLWRCGYRYQRQDDGLFLRAAITPVFMKKDAEGFQPDYFQFWGGLSIGVSF